MGKTLLVAYCWNSPFATRPPARWHGHRSGVVLDLCCVFGADGFDCGSEECSDQLSGVGLWSGD
jgi:hypothetical protein